MRMVIVFFVIGALFWGCNSLIYDDLKDCPQGVYVKFYSKNLCSDDSLFLGKVSSIIVFAFDQDDKLNTYVELEDIDLSKDFEVLMPVSNGNYSFIAWTGINKRIQKSSFNKRLTTKQDVLLTINSGDNTAVKIDPKEGIWNGESPVVFLPDPSEYGSLYKHTSINLQELTNRVRVIVEFDQTIMRYYDVAKLETTISSANGTINFNGYTPLNSPLLIYPSVETKFEENTASWYYSMLDLGREYKSWLNITYKGDTKTETMFSGDLVECILLKAISEGMSLDCENNFTLKFLIKDYCLDGPTSFSCDIYVNNWLLNSYSTDL